MHRANFDIQTIITMQSISGMRGIFKWLSANVGDDNWHYISIKNVSYRIISFRDLKHKFLFELAWSEQIREKPFDK
jgi:hypothetical protein